jgi:hypothetical protein
LIPLSRKSETVLILLATIKSKAAALKREVYVLYLAARDPRTPW